MLLLRNYKYDRNQTVHKCSLDDPLQTLGFLFPFEIQNGGYGRTQFNIGPYGEKVSKRFFSESTRTIENKLPRNVHWKVIYTDSICYADRKSKMTTTAGNKLTLDSLGKCSNAFFSSTTNMIKAKLYMNVHWMVLYKLQVFDLI